MPPVNPPGRGRISRDQVIAAALALVDVRGLDALTMRALGDALGVEAMSLYNHVANKDAILDGILELVAAEIEQPAEDPGDWRTAMRARAMSAHRTLLGHPWAGLLWVTRPHVGPARMAQLETILAGLRTAGFTDDLLDRAFHTLNNHVLGHAIQAVSFSASRTQPLQDAAPRFLDAMDQDAFPELAAHIRWHLAGEAGDDEFAFGLDLLLDGLERERVTADATPP